VGILGTTISPYLFFWQAGQEVEEERARGRRTGEEREGAGSRDNPAKVTERPMSDARMWPAAPWLRHPGSRGSVS